MSSRDLHCVLSDESDDWNIGIWSNVVARLFCRESLKGDNETNHKILLADPLADCEVRVAGQPANLGMLHVVGMKDGSTKGRVA